ncbi:MAG TPA: fluoride efflux transporter CrcB [Kofleriaceae bacterium]|nr:fluoride efflux transporter CrcB [Kofleriaceae bacterium]
MERLISVLVVGAGSAIGGILRYLVSLWAQARGWTSFPWATLIVNIVGCFVITLVMTIAAAVTLRTNMRLFLTTGMMGGLTTYSTFNYETTALFQGSATLSAFANIGATLVACFVAGLLGLALARLLVGE